MKFHLFGQSKTKYYTKLSPQVRDHSGMCFFLKILQHIQVNGGTRGLQEINELKYCQTNCVQTLTMYSIMDNTNSSLLEVISDCNATTFNYASAVYSRTLTL